MSLLTFTGDGARIEEAFNTAKRLLGLSYLWTGSINGVKLQVWATWLFYAVLIDLADAICASQQRFAIAEELALPFDQISLEMLFRGFYHFNQAYAKGRATDPVLFFAAPKNKNLNVVKTIRKKPQPFDLSPFPLPLTNPAGKGIVSTTVLSKILNTITYCQILYNFNLPRMLSQGVIQCPAPAMQF